MHPGALRGRRTRKKTWQLLHCTQEGLDTLLQPMLDSDRGTRRGRGRGSHACRRPWLRGVLSPPTNQLHAAPASLDMTAHLYCPAVSCLFICREQAGADEAPAGRSPLLEQHDPLHHPTWLPRLHRIHTKLSVPDHAACCCRCMYMQRAAGQSLHPCTSTHRDGLLVVPDSTAGWGRGQPSATQVTAHPLASPVTGGEGAWGAASGRPP